LLAVSLVLLVVLRLTSLAWWARAVSLSRQTLAVTCRCLFCRFQNMTWVMAEELALCYFHQQDTPRPEHSLADSK
jgi:hypothetical protein